MPGRTLAWELLCAAKARLADATAYAPAVTLPFHVTSCWRRSVVHVDAMFRWWRSGDTQIGDEKLGRAVAEMLMMGRVTPKTNRQLAENLR